MTKSLGKELAGEGILVNAITPAAAETDMAKEITPARRAEITSRIPMGRFVTVEEIAAMTGWLLSPACSFFDRRRVRPVRRPGHLLRQAWH